MQTLRQLFFLGFLFLSGVGSLVQTNAASTTNSLPKTLPPGVEAAQALSTVTGVAISPLFGMGAVGAWKYYHTQSSARAALPWFAQPWVWVPAFILVGLCFLKDTAGTLIPTAAKKPFDVLELFENKISGLVATGAIVPLVMAVASHFQATTSAATTTSTWGWAALDGSVVTSALAAPLSLVAYFLVFIASHALNVLILISPFATVDAGLKAIRLALLSSVAGTSFLNSTLGALWAGVILILCFLVAGWAFRLSIFGHIFAWDLITLRRGKETPSALPIPAFLAQTFGSTPVRTYGKLERSPTGELNFRWQPWLILPSRSITLPSKSLSIGRGVIHPELHSSTETSAQELVDFPPRYATQEEALARVVDAKSIHDVGIRAAWSWIKSAVSPARPTRDVRG